MFATTRAPRRGQTLVEVLVAIAILAVVVVFVGADLTNIERLDNEADRTLEISAANFLLGAMKSDPNFWQPDWATGPGTKCLAALGPYTDTGPSLAPSWHDMPSPSPGCSPFPFTNPGAPQSLPPGASPAPVGNKVQYMWNASQHHNNPFAADLTVWIRRDESSPVFEYHGIRTEYPGVIQPTASPGSTPTPPLTTPSPHPTPTPSPTPIGV